MSLMRTQRDIDAFDLLAKLHEAESERARQRFVMRNWLLIIGTLASALTALIFTLARKFK